MKWREIHRIDIIGIDTFVNTDYKHSYQFAPESIIIRLKQKPQNPVFYKYLIVVDENEIIISTKLPIFDIFNLKNLRNYKLKLKEIKKLNRKNIGIEIKLNEIRNCNSADLGKWVNCIRDIYKFSKLTNNQLILSSGAENENETISGNTFDAILKILEIEPIKYWNDLEKWIYMKNRVYYSASEKG